MNNTIRRHTVSVGEKDLTFQTGKLALQAHGAVEVFYGDTVILSTAMMSEQPREGMDFFPLLVEFDPKYYATGKIKGSRFMKREARPPESAILTMRMIDRPMRPLFPKGMKNDVQITGTLLQADGKRSVSPTAINGASMAVLLSGMPFETAVGAVRLGMDADGNFTLDPTFDECDTYGFDLVVAGTKDTILMVEAGANLIPKDKMLEALKFAHAEVKKICEAQIAFASEHEIVKKEGVFKVENEEAAQLVDANISEADLDGIGGALKKDIKNKLHALEERLVEACEEQIEEGTVSKGDLFGILNKRFAKNMRKRIFETGKRIDGRGVDDVRPLHVEVGMYPKVHGCALFQRGETQALSMLSLGGPSDGMILDDPDRDETTQMYLHHYNFPGFSVGEVKPSRGASRRDIGHGALAERALRPVVPTTEEGYPYFTRVVSEILTCNGSSSMASVCGSTLALMDGGVPIKKPISGVAMGLMMNDDGDYRVLTDIQSFEDFDGDMDFKMTGHDGCITALQLDMKLKGLPMQVFEDALSKGSDALDHILGAMLAVIPEPRSEMNESAPQIDSFKIDPDFIRMVIGKGGETIQKLCADFDVDINIEDDGMISITGKGEGLKQARKAIDAIVYVPKAGDVCDGIVKKIMDFGAFVEYAPGQEALVHVSNLADHRVENVTDIVGEGQKVRVEVLGKDERGRINLTMKGVDQS